MGKFGGVSFEGVSEIDCVLVGDGLSCPRKEFNLAGRKCEGAGNEGDGEVGEAALMGDMAGCRTTANSKDTVQLKEKDGTWTPCGREHADGNVLGDGDVGGDICNF